MELRVDDYPIFLPQNIRCLRKRQRWSQEELAQRVGLNRGNIASYEKGTAEPKICNLLKISNIFQISILDLTQKDLRDEDALNVATNNYQQFSSGERQLIHQFVKKSDELDEVFQSLHTCFQFKTQNMAEMPKDMQIMIAHFEQLFETGQTLMRNHRALLDFIRCRMK